jgi:G3E family GTPase
MSTDSRIPVTVLTGFLGSGKTTLMNHILQANHGKRIAIIENEFGEVGVDHELVLQSEEEIFEMNNGCICCTVRGDLIRILERLLKRRDKFDYILIETTGLADPGPVVQTFFMDDRLKDEFLLDSIVTLVDARHVHHHLDDAAECQKQIAFADVILLNKIDLVDEEQLTALEQKVTGMNKVASVHRTQHSLIELDKILNVKAFDLTAKAEINPDILVEELPFEWMGVYRLPRGEYRFQHEAGPDATMDILVVPAQNDSDSTIRVLKDQALELFSTDQLVCESGSRIRPQPQLLQLQTQDFGYVALPMVEDGLVVVFTQHLPEEFNASLVDAYGDSIAPIHEQRFASPHEHDDSVSSVGITGQGSLDSARFEQWMTNLLRSKGTDIFRMKGILSLQGEDKRFVFQGVHMLFDGMPDKPWGDSERTNQLVFIGRNLDREGLIEGFQSCLV